MTKEALIEKIESLPPERRAEVEDFVDFLRNRPRPEPRKTKPLELVERLRVQRERLLQAHGLYDTLPLIREFRENGV
jgi:hypothetical protein